MDRVSRVLQSWRPAKAYPNQDYDFHGTSLPPEILSDIFWSVTEGSLGRLSHLPTQATLALLLLVCRSWYDCGIALLYTRPIIPNDSLPLFLRTLKKSPSLAAFVRSIVFELHRTEPSKRIAWPLRRERENRDVPNILATITSSCPKLEGVAVRGCLHPVVDLPHPKFSISVNKPQLRRLHLDGSVVWDESFDHPSFDNLSLEEISLENFRYLDLRSLERLPNLRRTRIANCGVNLLGEFTNPSTPSTSLRQLEILSILSQPIQEVFAIHYLPFIPTLESLRLEGVWFPDYLHQIEYSRFTQMKHLMLAISRTDVDLPSVPSALRCMPALEELVIDCVRGDPSIVARVIEDLIPPLRENSALSFPALRTLVISGDSTLWDGDLADMEHNIEVLETLCKLRGVEVVLRRIAHQPGDNVGRPSRHARALGLEGMVTSNASSHLSPAYWGL
ncbi:hypothetical protein JAAARDRAFT_57470 [Jaapia argillacea MUCL 33604]|uniref:F-box domain-containing protein n=1 Tax=Jaapia argillacea MUCL 33604 TaxID=933084 RepID=A0A067Q7G8_9AGAM|nr:hypothetical protein JAAARDRAFT_57470 [Jaapia argillacea MUCL 33604]